MPRNTRISWFTEFGSAWFDTDSWSFVANVRGGPHIRGWIPFPARRSIQAAQRAVEVDVAGRLMWGEANYPALQAG